VSEVSGLQRRSLMIRSAYAACMLGAAFNHARILFQHGLFWSYGGVPWPSAAYWTSLTFLDPLAALLLFLRPRVGIAATAIIIATNVVHNLWVATWRAPTGQLASYVLSNPFTMSQLAFLLFVAVTARAAWIGAAGAAEAAHTTS